MNYFCTYNDWSDVEVQCWDKVREEFHFTLEPVVSSNSCKNHHGYMTTLITHTNFSVSEGHMIQYYMTAFRLS